MSTNPPSKNDYIRFALDGLRRTSLPKDDEKWGDITRVGMLANFTYAIATLYDYQKEEIDGKRPPIESAEELKAFIHQIAQWFDTGNPLGQAELRKVDVPPDPGHSSHVYISASAVPAAFDQFTHELFRRLQQNDDPKETAAYIAFEMIHHHRPFESNNRLTAHALADYVLMRAGERLPVFRGTKKQLLKDMNEASKSYENLSKFYKNQFITMARIRAPHEPIAPSNAWDVEESDVLDHRSTIFNPKYVLRGGKEGADRIALFNFVTGKYPQDLAVFKPSRMALHETVAALVTSVTMSNPQVFLQNFIRTNPLYFEEIVPQANELDSTFLAMADRFKHYAAFLVDDHFNVLNPQPGVREVLQQEKEIIERRIREGAYDPRSAESRDVLRTLVADKLLNKYYSIQVRSIVDIILNKYFAENRDITLSMKANPERIAWVTVGGPAAGKSSLSRLIDAERRKYGETAPVCRVNPDDYRELLFERTGEPIDALYGSLTHGETLRITDIIIGRLWEMVEKGRGPDMWIDMVSPTDKYRMELAKYDGAQVRLYVASCPAEEAVERAYKRAEQPGPDKGRYVPTSVILRGHRYVSHELPQALSKGAYVLRLFDTLPDSAIYGHTISTPLLVASTTGFDMSLEIHEVPGFMHFVKKAALNPRASSSEALYVQGETVPTMAKTLMEYVKGGITLNFRYPSSPSSDKEGERIMLHFAHIGGDRVHIDDLGGFLRHMGDPSLALEFLRRAALDGVRRDIRIQGSSGTKLLAYNGKLRYVPHPDINSFEYQILHKLNRFLESHYVKITE